MRPRCVELARVLKKTGSFYYHCDWHASHYVKVMLDQIFGENNFQNEIVWKRTTAHGDAKRAYPNVSDSIFLFSGGGEHTFNRVFLAHDPDNVSDKYRYVDERGRTYRLDNLRSPNPRPNLTYDYKGFKPHPNGWAVSFEKMQQLDADGRLAGDPQLPWPISAFFWQMWGPWRVVPTTPSRRKNSLEGAPFQDAQRPGAGFLVGSADHL